MAHTLAGQTAGDGGWDLQSPYSAGNRLLRHPCCPDLQDLHGRDKQALPEPGTDRWRPHSACTVSTACTPGFKDCFGGREWGWSTDASGERAPHGMPVPAWERPSVRACAFPDISPLFIGGHGEEPWWGGQSSTSSPSLPAWADRAAPLYLLSAFSVPLGLGGLKNSSGAGEAG